MVSLVRNFVMRSETRINKSPTAASKDLCETCNLKPKFFGKGVLHPYCSRTCARNGGRAVGIIECLLPGCHATGKTAFSNFCSEDHAIKGVLQNRAAGCTRCMVQPQVLGGLCIACDRRSRVGPRLQELNQDSSTFKDLRMQFLSEWERNEDKPPVFEKAYEVILPRDIRVRHDAYWAKNEGSEKIRTFYSALCICDLGFKDDNICDGRTCGICCTVKSSFKSFAFGRTFMEGRFGKGIYSSRNPACADRFSTSCTTSPYRVMIACDTVAPCENDSLDDAEIEETSVFTPIADGILPAFVVVYSIAI
ncbi:hypothetical protein Agabi119p4_6115 [Agaricus bisporus var. burnettii]|uniref:PARP catalytic domain-containing protein n=1 Tax=Agaricus bisporus var. burnettii TaxID=192524 RepID=A0A8H7F191_AGABI|nr:hypothetical protein Agabi119p4_6115 [Agaricus bisporus var. burnettii]